MRTTLCVLICLGAVAARPVQAAKFISSPVTDNAYHDANPFVSGHNIAWWATPSGTSKREIMFFDGFTATQISDNAFSNQDPQISGNNVVWWAQTGGNADTREIFLHDGNSEIQLTDDTDAPVRDEMPRVSGDKVVWQRGAGNGLEIMYYDGNTSTQLTTNTVFDGAHWIAGDYVVWVHDSTTPNQKVMLFDGNTITEVGGSEFAIVNARVSTEGVAVWESFRAAEPEEEITAANRREVFRAGSPDPINLSANSTQDFHPQISGDNVVWWSGVFPNFEIMLHNGTSATLISDNPLRDQNPQISGNNVVWIGFDGSFDQIFYYDGVMVTQLTDTPYNNSVPQISGAHVVWQASTPAGAEIMHAYVFLPGDENLDGVVDIADILTIGANWLTPGPTGDANGDGIVDIADILIAGSFWLQSIEWLPPAPLPASAVPEPATGTFAAWAMASLGLTWFARRRRRGA